MDVDVIWTIGCYALTNFLSAALIAFDKWCAVNGWYRVSENVLGLTALVGGWPGGWWAMRACNHKTIKQSFQVMYGCYAGLGLLLLIGAVTWFADTTFARLMILTVMAYGGVATLCVIWMLAVVWALSGVPHSTAQHSTAQRRTAQLSTAQRRTAQQSAVPAGPVRGPVGQRNPPL